MFFLYWLIQMIVKRFCCSGEWLSDIFFVVVVFEFLKLIGWDGAMLRIELICEI